LDGCTWNLLKVNPMSVGTGSDTRLYEKLLAIFPGYRGYKEKEVLRETDRVVRERIYILLKELEEHLKRLYSRAALLQATASDATFMESVIYRVDSVAERVRHAPHGYRPLFNVVKVDEEKLRKLQDYDLSLGERVTRLLSEVRERSGKASSLDEVRGLFNYVLGELGEVEALVNSRENYILLL